MEKTLPKVTKGDKVLWDDILPKKHLTKPISRFTEASLVKELESLGIGRPSTYASIVSTLYNRKYTLTKDIDSVTKEEPFHKLDKNDKITDGIKKVKSAKL